MGLSFTPDRLSAWFKNFFSSIVARREIENNGKKVMNGIQFVNFLFYFIYTQIRGIADKT